MGASVLIIARWYQATVANDGTFSFTSTTLADRAVTLTAKATDAAGNTSVASTGLAVTVDTSAPLFVSAAVNSTSLVLTYDGALNTADGPATGDFAALANGNSVTVSSVTVVGSTVELTLANAVGFGQTVTVGYTDPTNGNDVNAIQEAAGNDAVDIVGQNVTNNTI